MPRTARLLVSVLSRSLVLVLALSLSLGALAACGERSPPRGTIARWSPPPELERVDVFGSKKLGREELLYRWGERIARHLRKPSYREQRAIEEEIAAFGGFAYVSIATITYSEKEQYTTIDLVDAEDRARRMTFDPAPAGTHGDPDGLIALWEAYEDKAVGMMMDGTVKHDAEPCPFWHCFTFAHPSLVRYREAFAARVPAAERELVAVLREERRDDRRAAAAYLVAHLASGERVVELLLPSIRDPSELVRNNAMRVLAMIAMNHPEIAIPVGPIVAALHYPSTLDRNKAAAILAGLTSRELGAAAREQIIAGAGEVLVEMLALKQPNNHDFAYRILKQVSGRDLGEHAIESWRAWLRTR